MLDISLAQAGSLNRLKTDTVTFHLDDGSTLEISSADGAPEQNALVLRVPVTDGSEQAGRLRITPGAANLLVVEVVR